MLPGDVRHKAARLIAKGDQLTQEGDLAGARMMYDQALGVLQQTGVHHLRKKVLDRLVQFEEVR